MLTLTLLGIGIWVYTQGQTEHQICQLVQGVGKQNSSSITTNRGLILNDLKLKTPAAKADVATRRAAIKRSTDIQILINKIHC